MIVAKSEIHQIEKGNNMNHTEIPTIEKKTKTNNQIMVPAPVIVKCQLCQAPMDQFVDAVSPDHVDYSSSNVDASVLKAQPGEEYTIRCLCNCLSLPEKPPTEIICLKSDCTEETKEQHVCCILCAHPFRFYSPIRNDHCSHCTTYSKFVHVIAVFCFFMISICVPLLLTTVPFMLINYSGFVSCLYHLTDFKNWPIHRKCDSNSDNDFPLCTMSFALVLIISLLTFLTVHKSINELERPFTMRDFWAKFIDNALKILKAVICRIH